MDVAKNQAFAAPNVVVIRPPGLQRFRSNVACASPVLRERYYACQTKLTNAGAVPKWYAGTFCPVFVGRSSTAVFVPSPLDIQIQGVRLIPDMCLLA